MIGKVEKIVIPSVRYEIWGWPAAVNFILGGTAAGFYLFGLLDMIWFQPGVQAAPWLRHNLLGPFLAAAGFLIVGMEAGRPSRGIYLLHHLKRSWMSREVLAGILFIFFPLADWIFPAPILKAAAAVSAAGLLFCQGLMVYKAPAIVAWSRSVTPVHSMIAGLAMGFGLYLVWTAAISRTTISLNLLLLGMVCLAVSLALWCQIVRPKTDPIEDRAAAYFRNALSMTLTMGFGQMVPLLMVIAMAVMNGVGLYAAAVRWVALLAGLCIIFGGALQKTALILQANTLHPIKASTPRFNRPDCLFIAKNVGQQPLPK